MSIILTPFAKLLLLFYNITGSYGVSIILFGLVVRLVLSPIFLKGRKGMLAMSGLAEKQKVLFHILKRSLWLPRTYRVSDNAVLLLQGRQIRQ